MTFRGTSVANGVRAEAHEMMRRFADVASLLFSTAGGPLRVRATWWRGVDHHDVVVLMHGERFRLGREVIEGDGVAQELKCCLDGSVA